MAERLIWKLGMTRDFLKSLPDEEIVNELIKMGVDEEMLGQLDHEGLIGLLDDMDNLDDEDLKDFDSKIVPMIRGQTGDSGMVMMVSSDRVIPTYAETLVDGIYPLSYLEGSIIDDGRGLTLRADDGVEYKLYAIPDDSIDFMNFVNECLPDFIPDNVNDLTASDEYLDDDLAYNEVINNLPELINDEDVIKDYAYIPAFEDCRKRILNELTTNESLGESLNEGIEQSVDDKLKKLVDWFALDGYKKRGNMYYFYGGGKITDRLSAKDVEEKSFNELFKLINDNDIDESLSEAYGFGKQVKLNASIAEDIIENIFDEDEEFRDEKIRDLLYATWTVYDSTGSGYRLVCEDDGMPEELIGFEIEVPTSAILDESLSEDLDEYQQLKEGIQKFCIKYNGKGNSYITKAALDPDNNNVGGIRDVIDHKSNDTLLFDSRKEAKNFVEDLMYEYNLDNSDLKVEEFFHFGGMILDSLSEDLDKKPVEEAYIRKEIKSKELWGYINQVLKRFYSRLQDEDGIIDPYDIAEILKNKYEISGSDNNVTHLVKDIVDTLAEYKGEVSSNYSLQLKKAPDTDYYLVPTGFEFDESLHEAGNIPALKRIARYHEFDNGHVLHHWEKMPPEEAEEKARVASTNDPSDIYYVAYDDLMNSSSDKRYFAGNEYTSTDDARNAYQKYHKIGKHGNGFDESLHEGCNVDESVSLPPLKNSDERLKLVDELSQIKQMSLTDLTGLDLLATDMSDGSVEELFPIFAKVATAYIKEIAQKDEKNNKDRINYWWWDFDKADLKAVIKACELLVPNDKYPEGKSVVRGIARFLSDDDEGEESLTEANNNKCWVLFFDETGHNRAGSEWSHAFNTQPNIAERRILAPDYVKPKGAVGYMILSDSEFNSLDYDKIDKNYKRWGKKLHTNESLVEASSYANAAEYADTYRGRLADITIYKVGDKFTTNYGTTHVTGDTVEEVKGKLEDLMNKDFKKAQGYLEDLHEDDVLDDRKKAIIEEINSCQDLEEDAGEDEDEYKNPNVVNSAPIKMF